MNCLIFLCGAHHYYMEDCGERSPFDECSGYLGGWRRNDGVGIFGGRGWTETGGVGTEERGVASVGR